MVQLILLRQAGLMQSLHKSPTETINGCKGFLLQERSHFTKTKYVLIIHTLAVKVYTFTVIPSLHLKLSEAQIWKVTAPLKKRKNLKKPNQNKTKPQTEHYKNATHKQN